jgi:DNA-binding transcriptional ArsR family regulator
VALAGRDLAWSPRPLAEALRTFEAHGDRENATHARLLQVRRLLLIGRVDEADGAVATLERELPARLAAVAALVAFEIALRRGRPGPARAALEAAREAAGRSEIPALVAEVDHAGRALDLPAARLVAAGEGRPVTLAEAAEVLASADLVVDGCRRAARRGERVVRLFRRPVLFALLRTLAEAWPQDATRAVLIEQAFGARRPNAIASRPITGGDGSVAPGAAPARRGAGPPGRVRAPARGAGVVRLLLPPIESPDAAVLALLADGEGWSTSALALALGSSQRTVQRALRTLEESGQARSVGRGRSQRWLSAPIAGFATTLLLPGSEGFG